MKDVDLILGELKEFKRATLKELEQIKKDVHTLSIFKWKVTGIMTFLVGASEVIHMFIINKG